MKTETLFLLPAVVKMESNIEKEDLELFEKALILLRTRFTNVQIFGSRESGVEDMVERGTNIGNTVFCQRGCGNWFARYGQVSLWLIEQKEIERENVRKRTEED